VQAKVFAAGTYSARIRAVDNQDKEQIDPFQVIVPDQNKLQVTLSLSAGGITGTRCVELRLYDCGQPAVNLDGPLAFAGSTVTKEFIVPSAAYDCVTARVNLHTLTKKASVVDAGDKWTASLTLRVGNIDGRDTSGNEYIDIVDFTLLAEQFINGANGACNPATCLASSDASAGSARCYNADFNGDGVVTVDLPMLLANYLTIGETSCCPGGSPILAKGSGPRASMSVKELKKLGVTNAQLADQNRDGVVDSKDVELLTNSLARQQPTTMKKSLK
jgi:hypothetical protein